MKLNNSHKALAITLLLSGTFILTIFNFSVYKASINIPEFNVTVEMIKEELKEIADLELNENSKQTNKAFNQTEDYKHYADAYKPIAPPKDYDYTKYNARNDKPDDSKKPEESPDNSTIKDNELSSFESINSVLKKHAKSKAAGPSHASANLNSTVRYSLEGRTDLYLPIPVYLCEAFGQVIVDISVNDYGSVVKSRVNKSLSSNNACLKEHALEYANKARFNTSSKKMQTGTITFHFKGK